MGQRPSERVCPVPEGESVDLTVHHVCVTVADLDRSIAFYKALGFAPSAPFGPPDGSRTIVQMVKGDGMIELIGYAAGVALRPAPGGPVAGLKHIGLRTVDVRATLAELEALGLTSPGVPVNETAYGITMAFITDPDGTSIEILSLPGE
jgi:catechol 2,3-dioxygenase-like lactoylglutathione lyase family enzyme